MGALMAEVLEFFRLLLWRIEYRLPLEMTDPARWEAFFQVLLQPITYTLPIAVFWYILGYKVCRWQRWEFLLSFVPWVVTIALLAMVQGDDGDIDFIGPQCAFVGGFVLFPRIFYWIVRDKSVTLTPRVAAFRFKITLMTAIVATVLSVLSSPILFYLLAALFPGE